MRAADPFGFVSAISNASTPARQWRIYAERPDGKIGVTAWYCGEDTLDEMRAEIAEHGHKVVRVERKDA